MLEHVIQIKSGIMINANVSVKIRKIIICAKRIIFTILLHVVVKMINVRSIIDDTVITCGDIIEETKTVSKNFDIKKTTHKTQTSISYLPFD